MSPVRTCCCQPEIGCLWAPEWDLENPALCEHTIESNLFLRVPRDGVCFTSLAAGLQGTFCACTGQAPFQIDYCVQPGDELRAYYQHFNNFQGEPGTTGYDYPWAYFTGGVYGNNNPPNPNSFFPSCNSGCCGDNRDSECCDSWVFPGQTSCPTGYYTPENFERTLPLSPEVTKRASQYQMEAIRDGASKPIDPANSDAGNCPFGKQYKWLQGVSNRKTSHRFKSWYVFQNSIRERFGGANFHLCETLLAVFHQEKWWRRYDHNFENADPAVGGNHWCRTPIDWIFACSGIPVYGWELLDPLVYPELDDPNIAPGFDREDCFMRIHQQNPLPLSYTNAMMAVGILSFYQPPEGDDRPIRKRMRFYNTGTGGWQTSESRFYAREGGWDFVCNGATNSGGNYENPEYPMEGSNAWPNVARRSSTFGGTASCSGNKGYGNQYPDGSKLTCWTAAPIPAEVTCDTGVSCGGVNACDMPGGGCAVAFQSSCGGNGMFVKTCDSDAWSASCKSILFQYQSYTEGGSDVDCPEYACSQHRAFLCVTDPASPESCSETEEIDWNLMASRLFHWIPEQVSQMWRRGCFPLSNLCCGGRGLRQVTGSFTDCPASNPVSDDCWFQLLARSVRKPWEFFVKKSSSPNNDKIRPEENDE